MIGDIFVNTGVRLSKVDVLKVVNIQLSMQSVLNKY